MPRHLLAPVFITACLLLGGSSQAGFVANLVLQLMALPILCLGLWTLGTSPPSNLQRAPLLFALAIIALLLLQLVPLPPSIWTALPGRLPVLAGFRLLDIPVTWMPLSLYPNGTIASLLALIPAMAMLLAVMALGAFRGSLVSWSLLAITAVSVAIGALQLVGGPSSGAYIYQKTSFGVAVGFFANGNHMATLLLVSIPFLGALQLSLLRRARSPRNVSAVRLLMSAMVVVFIVGIITNFSLAGLGLSVPVALISFFSFRKNTSRPKWWMLGITAVVSAFAVAIILFGPFGNNLIGEQRNYAQLTRQTSFRLTIDAAREYLPFGSGVGTFREIYHTQEPLADVITTYVNHAHNDYLEILLETGLAGIALIVTFLIWWLLRVRAIWSASNPDYYARAGAIASGAILLHSLVDYPLRTAAISSIFALSVALMSESRPFARRKSSGQSERHLAL